MPEKSKGHIAFVYSEYDKGDIEFFERDGHVYRAGVHRDIQTDGYRHGNWECSRKHFEDFADVAPLYNEALTQE